MNKQWAFVLIPKSKASVYTKIVLDTMSKNFDVKHLRDENKIHTLRMYMKRFGHDLSKLKHNSSPRQLKVTR